MISSVPSNGLNKAHSPIQVRLSAFVSPTTLVFYMLVLIAIGNALLEGPKYFLFNALISFFCGLHLVLTKPERLIRKYNLVSITENDDALSKSISSIAKSLGIQKRPQVLVAQPASIGGPFAFGTFTRTYIVIPRSYFDVFLRYPDEFESIIRHELAHIKSADTWKYELTISLLWVFLSIKILRIIINIISPTLFNLDPLITGEFVSAYIEQGRNYFIPLLYPTVHINRLLEFENPIHFSNPAGMLSTFAFAIFEIPLALFCLSALIRARELYADALAADGYGRRLLARSLIRSGLRGLQIEVGQRWYQKIWYSFLRFKRRITGWLKFHPSTNERLKSLEDSKHALKMFSLIATLGGITFSVTNWTLGLAQVESIFYTGDESSAYLLPVMLGFLLLSVINSPFVVGWYQNPKMLLCHAYVNVFVYSFAVFIAQLVFGVTMYFAVQVALATPPYNLFISDLDLHIQFEITQALIIIGIVMPLALLIGVTLDIFFKHSLILSCSKRIYTLHSTLGMLIIGFGLWIGILLPAVRMIGPNWVGLGSAAPEACSSLFAIWTLSDPESCPTTLVFDTSQLASAFGDPFSSVSKFALGGGVCFILIIIWACLKRRQQCLCHNCDFEIPFQGSADLCCQNCGQLVSHWTIARY